MSGASELRFLLPVAVSPRARSCFVSLPPRVCRAVRSASPHDAAITLRLEWTCHAHAPATPGAVTVAADASPNTASERRVFVGWNGGEVNGGLAAVFVDAAGCIAGIQPSSFTASSFAGAGGPAMAMGERVGNGDEVVVVPWALAVALGLLAGPGGAAVPLGRRLAASVCVEPRGVRCKRLEVQPAEADDWDVVCARAGALEDELLAQVAVVAVGQVTTRKRSLSVVAKATDTSIAPARADDGRWGTLAIAARPLFDFLGTAEYRPTSFRVRRWCRCGCQVAGSCGCACCVSSPTRPTLLQRWPCASASTPSCTLCPGRARPTPLGPRRALLMAGALRRCCGCRASSGQGGRLRANVDVAAAACPPRQVVGPRLLVAQAAAAPVAALTMPRSSRWRG